MSKSHRVRAATIGGEQGAFAQDVHPTHEPARMSSDMRGGGRVEQLGAASDFFEPMDISMTMRKGGDGYDYFFLSMAHWQLDQKDQARMWYGKAVEWMKRNMPQDKEMLLFRSEADQLMKQK